MSFESVSPKHLNEIEQLTRELLTVLRKASLQNAPVVAALQQFENEVAQERRQRFDAVNPEYIGF